MELYELKPQDLPETTYYNSINPFIIEKYLTDTKQKVLNIWLNSFKTQDEKNKFYQWYRSYFGYKPHFGCSFDQYVKGYIEMQRYIDNRYKLDPSIVYSTIFPEKKAENKPLKKAFSRFAGKITFDNNNKTIEELTLLLFVYDTQCIFPRHEVLRTIIKKIIDNDFLIDNFDPQTKKGLPLDLRKKYPKTKHPIFLLHGLAGFKKVGILNYWGKIIKKLEQEGYKIHKLSCGYIGTLASSYWRQEILLKHIFKLMEKHNYKSIHLVGHSQGGIDSRILISACGLSKIVKSISTIGTPHRGIDFFFTSMYRMMKWTPYRLRILNAKLKENGVPIISYAGKAEEKINFLFKPLKYLWNEENLSDDHDGIVSVESSLYQNNGGIVKADHLELIWGNLDNSFDMDLFYRIVIGRLVEEE